MAECESNSSKKNNCAEFGEREACKDNEEVNIGEKKRKRKRQRKKVKNDQSNLKNDDQDDVNADHKEDILKTQMDNTSSNSNLIESDNILHFPIKKEEQNRKSKKSVQLIKENCKNNSSIEERGKDLRKFEPKEALQNNDHSNTTPTSVDVATSNTQKPLKHHYRQGSPHFPGLEVENAVHKFWELPVKKAKKKKKKNNSEDICNESKDSSIREEKEGKCQEVERPESHRNTPVANAGETSKERKNKGNETALGLMGQTCCKKTLKMFAENGIFPLKKKSTRFLRALYFCRLCDYHMDTVEDVEKHMKDTRHSHRRELKKIEKALKRMPGPCTDQLLALDGLLEKVYLENAFTEEDANYRKELTDKVEKLLRETDPNVSIALYGSSLYELALQDSNVNMNLIIPHGQCHVKTLTSAYKALQESDMFEGVRSDFSAVMPSVFFIDKHSGLECQLALGGNTVLLTGKLLAIYVGMDVRVKKLGTVFRYFAKVCHIDSKEDGMLPSFAFVLMLIFFFQQCKKPVLPILYEGAEEVEIRSPTKRRPQLPSSEVDFEEIMEMADNWTSENTESLGSLWLGLLKFYCLQFDLSRNVVSIRFKRLVTRMEKKWNTKRLSVEDPFANKRNLARNVANNDIVKYIWDCFHKAYFYFGLPSNYHTLSKAEKQEYNKMTMALGQLSGAVNVKEVLEKQNKEEGHAASDDDKDMSMDSHSSSESENEDELVEKEMTNVASETCGFADLQTLVASKKALHVNEIEILGETSSSDTTESGKDQMESVVQKLFNMEISRRSQGKNGPNSEVNCSLVDAPDLSCVSSAPLEEEACALDIAKDCVENIIDTSLKIVTGKVIITMSSDSLDNFGVRGVSSSASNDKKSPEILTNKVKHSDALMEVVENEHNVTCHVDKLNETKTETSLPVTDKTKLDNVSDFPKLSFTYEFSDKNFTDGKGPRKVCTLCEKEGHMKNACPEETLPEIKPLGAMDKGFTDSISYAIRCILDKYALNKYEYKERDSVRKELEEFLKEWNPDARLSLFGSSENGFGFKNSDLDLCLTYEGLTLPEDVEKLDYVDIIEQVATKLKTHKGLYSVFPITTAKVPIVKFRHRKTQLEGDISLYNILALQNTKMIRMYANMDPRVQLLGYAIKVFAKECDIGDASKGSLSSYAFILMMIHYLQHCQPPVLPVLQELFPGNTKPEFIVDGWNAWYLKDVNILRKVWKCKNFQSEGELWLGMFRYYMEMFNIKENVISIRQFEPLTKFEKLWNGNSIAIEDPFDLSHNLGGALSRKMNQYILKAFVNGRWLYGNAHPIPVEYRTPLDYFFDKKFLAEGSPPSDRLCRACNKIGHIAKECPRVQMRKEREQREKRERALAEEQGLTKNKNQKQKSGNNIRSRQYSEGEGYRKDYPVEHQRRFSENEIGNEKHEQGFVDGRVNKQTNRSQNNIQELRNRSYGDNMRTQEHKNYYSRQNSAPNPSLNEVQNNHHKNNSPQFRNTTPANQNVPGHFKGFYGYQGPSVPSSNRNAYPQQGLLPFPSPKQHQHPMEASPIKQNGRPPQQVPSNPGRFPIQRENQDINPCKYSNFRSPNEERQVQPPLHPWMQQIVCVPPSGSYHNNHQHVTNQPYTNTFIAPYTHQQSMYIYPSSGVGSNRESLNNPPVCVGATTSQCEGGGVAIGGGDQHYTLLHNQRTIDEKDVLPPGNEKNMQYQGASKSNKNRKWTQHQQETVGKR